MAGIRHVTFIFIYKMSKNFSSKYHFIDHVLVRFWFYYLIPTHIACAWVVFYPFTSNENNGEIFEQSPSETNLERYDMLSFDSEISVKMLHTHAMVLVLLSLT